MQKRKLVMQYYLQPWAAPIEQEISLGECCLIRQFYDICSHYEATVEVIFDTNNRVVLYRDDENKLENKWVVSSIESKEYRYSIYNDALDMLIILSGSAEFQLGEPPIKRIAHLGTKISFVLQ